MSRPRAETIPAVTVPSNPNGVPVNKGNSGGPTFDMDGNVIGVNTAIFSPSGGSVGIAFDIPAETVKSVVAQLKDNGMVSRGWPGVQIQAPAEGATEMALHVLAYNLTRVINIIGVQRLLAAMKTCLGCGFRRVAAFA
jgi:S1-C subfamily serine protease